MAKAKPRATTRGDGGEVISNTPQQGLLGDGATLDLLRPLIDQLVKQGLDALVNWLKGAKAKGLLDHQHDQTDPPCNCLVPACPDAAGTYRLVCNNGQMSWQLEGALQQTKPEGDEPEAEDNEK